MGYSEVALKEKIAQMYPEIGELGVKLGLTWDTAKNAYIVSMVKNGKALTTHLEKKDADSCMDGIMCVYLGVQVKQFLDNFKART